MSSTSIHAAAESAPVAETGAGGFVVHVDTANGVIHVRGDGFWTLRILDEHFDRLGRTVHERRAGGPVKVLVDLQQADVQQPNIIARIGQRTSEIYQAEDRVAIVVSSSLAKLQLRRSVQRLQHEFFLSGRAAQMWLHAYS